MRDIDTNLYGEQQLSFPNEFYFWFAFTLVCVYLPYGKSYALRYEVNGRTNSQSFIFRRYAMKKSKDTILNSYLFTAVEGVGDISSVLDKHKEISYIICRKSGTVKSQCQEVTAFILLDLKPETN